MACFVHGCSSHSSRCLKGSNDGEHISFHGFPKNEEIKEKWAKLLRRPKESVTKYSRVCSKHFLRSDFSCPEDQKRRRLLPDALPVLFLGCDSNMTEGVAQFTVKEEKMETNEFECQQNQPSTSACRDPLLDVITPQPTFRNPKESPAYVKLLETKLKQARKISQKRLLKINSMRQKMRRLKKRSDFLNEKLTELLEKVEIDVS